MLIRGGESAGEEVALWLLLVRAMGVVVPEGEVMVKVGTRLAVVFEGSDMLSRRRGIGGEAREIACATDSDDGVGEIMLESCTENRVERERYMRGSCWRCRCILS